MIDNLKCKLCGSESRLVDSNLLYLKKFSANLYQCKDCELLQLDKVNWFDVAYSESIALTDTGLVQRNLMLLKRVLVFLSVSSLRLRIPILILRIFKGILKLFVSRIITPFSGKILDYGGGYGLLVRLLRDVGIDSYWNDLYTKNLLAKGFEKRNEHYKAVMSFEVFEHLENPKKELDDIFTVLKPDIFITSTLSYGNKVPDRNWWYYSFETGQHISFYNEVTFKKIAELYGYHYFSVDNTFHIFSKNRLDCELIRFFVLRSDFFFDKISLRYKSLTMADHKNLIEKIV